jgi:biofilm PGA synthesis N-glycosyltransferase PgaC
MSRLDERRLRPLRVVALVPAHNEETEIATTLQSLFAQSRPVDRVIVVADNCTDRTVEIAASMGAEVLATTANRDRKAGALNQAWTRLRDDLHESDVLLSMDADTQLSRDFVANALVHLEREPDLAAICASFSGRRAGQSFPGRLLSLLQAMEYERYRRQIARRQGRTQVLSGGATIFRVRELAALQDERGFLYDTSSIVEDFELTLALRARGSKYLAPKNCAASTELMPTLTKLWHQRVRWNRGTLDELRKYGFSRLTARDYFAQALNASAVVLRALFIVAAVLAVLIAGGLRPNGLWLALGAVVAVERAVSVRVLGARAVLLAGTVVVEMVYALVGESYFARSCWLHLRNRESVWHPT